MTAVRDLPAAVLAALYILSTVALPTNAPPGEVTPHGAEEVPLWRKYFVNDTLTGRVVSCSAKEKFCLERGLLLDETSGKCFLWGRNGPCQKITESFRVDKKEFLTSGHVRGVCTRRHLCNDSTEYKMAADGSCLYMGEVSDICYGVPGVAISEDWFGETVCACSTFTKSPCPVQQEVTHSPSKNISRDLCRVPNFQKTILPGLSWNSKLSTPRSEVPCSETEHRCFLDGRLYFEPRDLCFFVWKQGPCEDGQWFILDQEEAINGTGRLLGTCENLPCGTGRVKSVVDGSCQTAEELCGGYGVTYDAHGSAACVTTLGYDILKLPTIRKTKGVCHFSGPNTWPPPPLQPHKIPPQAPPACPDSKTGYCDRDVKKPVVLK